MTQTVRFSIFGRRLVGFQADPHVHLLYAPSGKRAESAVIEALGRLGVSVESVSDLLEIDFDVLEGAITREKARVVQAEAAHRDTIAAYVQECAARVEAFDVTRREYEANTIPAKRKAAEDMIAAILVDGEVPEPLARLAEVVRDEAEMSVEESAWERKCRVILSDAHELARTSVFKPYPEEFSDLAGALIPNAIELIRSVVDERKATRAAKAEELRAGLKLLGVM